MCLLMTVDKRFYDSHAPLIMHALWRASQAHTGGLSLLTYDGANDSLLRTMDIRQFMRMLDTPGWTRAWMHLRKVVTRYAGVGHTHGATQGDWITMYNGRPKNIPLASNPSETVGNAIARHVWSSLVTNEDYLNAFLINPRAGEWHMARAKQGDFFSDGGMNFSSLAIGPMEIAVPERTLMTFAMKG